MAARQQEAIHAKKLEQALRSHDRFPINLEWMVDVFKYKHISSLTTHLKRHFKMNVHYKRFAQEQNKRVWTYFITVDCFIGICEYVRHAARKKIANVWLRKVGIKGTARRVIRERDEYPEPSEDEDDDMYDEEDEGEDDEQEYEYYNEEVAVKRRRVDEDEEYCVEDDEDDEDDEERNYFQEMEEEEAAAEYETDDSVGDYDSSSSRADTPPLRYSASLTIGASGRPYRAAVPYPSGTVYRPELTSSGESSSPCSSPPSSPTSPRSDRVQLVNSTNLTPVMGLNSFGYLPATNTTVQPPKYVSVQDVVPTEASDAKEQVDWSYLHLRPNPHPMSQALDPTKMGPASLLFPPYCYYNPQLSTCNFMFTPNPLLSNCHWLLPSNVSDTSFSMRHDNLDQPIMEDRAFDTNMFLSFSDCSHSQQ